MSQGKVDIHGRSHAQAGIQGAGRYQGERKLEAVSALASDTGHGLSDVSLDLRSARIRHDALLVQGAALAERASEISLRLDSIVSMVNDPEYAAAFADVQSSSSDLKAVHRELKDRYTTHYRDAGARLGSWLAADSFDRSFNEEPQLMGIMSMKTKSRGADAAESHLAADLARKDPETQKFEATQRTLHATLVDALKRKDNLARELQGGQDERWKLLQERYQTDRALLSNQQESARAETLTEQLRALEDIIGAGSRAQIAHPNNDEPLTVHENEDGGLNVLVWRDADETNASGRWLHATGYELRIGNVRTGAKLHLTDGSSACWDGNLHTKQASGHESPVAILEPAAGSTKLGREHGWGGLVNIIDSSG